MSSTPGVVFLIEAMYSEILRPGISPPSPGFAPCAIFICKSFAFTR